MKHFYHFYVEFNNIENRDLALELDEIRIIDEQWHKLLEKTKLSVPQEFIDAMTDKIYKQLF